MNRRQFRFALTCKGTQVKALRNIVFLKIAIDRICPFTAPDLGISSIVPINRILLVAFPFAGRQTAPLTIFIKVINLMRFRKPLSIIVHGSHRQHDMHMRVSVAFVVDGKIRNHTTRNKLLQAVITDQRFIFFPGQLSRQCCDDAAGKLRVPLTLDLFNGIPQHLPIHVLRRCVRWQKNALCHNLR